MFSRLIVGIVTVWATAAGGAELRINKHYVFSVLTSLFSQTPFQRKCQEHFEDPARVATWEALGEFKDLARLEDGLLHAKHTGSGRLEKVSGNLESLSAEHKRLIASMIADIETDLLSSEGSTFVEGEFLSGQDVYDYVVGVEEEAQRLDNLMKKPNSKAPKVRRATLAILLAELALLSPIAAYPNLITFAVLAPFLAINTRYGVWPIVENLKQEGFKGQDVSYALHLLELKLGESIFKDWPSFKDELGSSYLTQHFSYFHMKIPVPTYLQEDLRTRRLSESDFVSLCRTYSAATPLEAAYRYLKTSLSKGGPTQYIADHNKNFPRETPMRFAIVDQIFYYKEGIPHLITYLRSERQMTNSGPKKRQPLEKPVESPLPGAVPQG